MDYNKLRGFLLSRSRVDREQMLVRFRASAENPTLFLFGCPSEPYLDRNTYYIEHEKHSTVRVLLRTRALLNARNFFGTNLLGTKGWYVRIRN